ncbi:MAG: hypothetical protein ACR2PR_09155 [Pseudohongiellaceae bacterium]
MMPGTDSGDAVLVAFAADEGGNSVSHTLTLEFPTEDGKGTEQKKYKVAFVRDPQTGQWVYPLSDKENLTDLEQAILNEFARQEILIPEDAEGIQNGVKVMSRADLAAGSRDYYAKVIAKMDDMQFKNWLKGLRDVRYFEAARAALGSIGEYDKVAQVKACQAEFMEANKFIAEKEKEAQAAHAPEPAEPTPPPAAAAVAPTTTPPPTTPDTPPPSFTTKTTAEIIAEVKANPEGMTTKTGNPSRAHITAFAGRPVEDAEFDEIKTALEEPAE